MPSNTLAWLRLLTRKTSAASLSLALLLALFSSGLAAENAHPKPVLTLQEALARAEATDPALRAAASRLEASKAAERQAAALPNPSVALEVENFGGSGPNRSLDSAETTLAIEQTVELGGKREARTRLAQREGDLARSRADLAKLNLFQQVEEAWVEAIAAEAAVELANERLSVAERLGAEVARRVRSARDPMFATARAEADTAAARVALNKAESDAQAAKIALASWWGGEPDFVLDVAAFEHISARAVADATLSADEAALLAERDVARANIDVERSRALPDPALSLGVRQFNENDEYALVVGASVPLPLFDSNQGNIDRAIAESAAADLEFEAGRRNRERQIAQAQSRLSNAAMEAKLLAEKVIPEAERAVRLIREGFNRGSFGYLDLIEAQRALLDAREQRIEALKDYHLNQSALDRLTGAHATAAARQEISQ